MAARSSPLIGAIRSPAIRPAGQTQIDPSRHGEYPIVLGEKLAKGDASSSKQFYGIRYNYKSKHSSAKQTTTIKRGATEKTFELDIDDYPEGHDPIAFRYRGGVDPKSSALDETPTTLALVFDQDKQVFVVEPISAELNFNLVSGPGQPRQHPQLPVLDDSGDEDVVEQELFGEGPSSASEDEPPDSNNPFDYRHFLEEARANTKTDVRPGTSPSIQPQSSLGRHLTTSKSSGQSPIVTSVKKPVPKPAISKTSTIKASTRGPNAKVGPPGAKSKSGSAPKQQTPKSAAVITASDEDSSDETPLATKSGAKAQVRASKHTHNTNHGYSSPKIVVDEASGLEIDMGSPPPEPRNRGKINPSAFASRSPSNSLSTNQSPAPHVHQLSDDSDRDMADVQDNGDSDIEALSLPPPKADTRRPSMNVPRRVSTEHQPVGGGDIDEEDDPDDQAFAAMMEQELAQEEESEVSEEE